MSEKGGAHSQLNVEPIFFTFLLSRKKYFRSSASCCRKTRGSLLRGCCRCETCRRARVAVCQLLFSQHARMLREAVCGEELFASLHQCAVFAALCLQSLDVWRRAVRKQILCRTRRTNPLRMTAMRLGCAHCTDAECSAICPRCHM